MKKAPFSRLLLAFLLIAFLCASFLQRKAGKKFDDIIERVSFCRDDHWSAPAVRLNDRRDTLGAHTQPFVGATIGRPPGGGVCAPLHMAHLNFARVRVPPCLQGGNRRYLSDMRMDSSRKVLHCTHHPKRTWRISVSLTFSPNLPFCKEIFRKPLDTGARIRYNGITSPR